MLSDWIFDPAGLSTPSGVPETSRMNTGTSTVGPSAVTVPTVMASCAAADAARARAPRTAIRVFFTGGLLQTFPRRSRLDRRAAHLQRAGRHGGASRSGAIGQQR